MIQDNMIVLKNWQKSQLNQLQKKMRLKKEN